MKRLYLIAIILWGLSSPVALAKYKYQEGDCVSTTNQTLQWKEQVALVLGVFKRIDSDDPNNTVYLLRVLEGSAPWQKNWDERLRGVSAHDASLIDENTVKVPKWMCGRS